MTRDRVATLDDLLACPEPHDSTPAVSEPPPDDACSGEPYDGNRAFPASYAGQMDCGLPGAAPRPCCKPVRWSGHPLAWCSMPDQHDGPCDAPPPKPIETEDLGPASSRRRRW